MAANPSLFWLIFALLVDADMEGGIPTRLGGPCPPGAACSSPCAALPVHLLCITSQSDFPKSLVSDLICLTLLLESALPQPLPATAFQQPMGRSVPGEAEEQRGTE